MRTGILSCLWLGATALEHTSTTTTTTHETPSNRLRRREGAKPVVIVENIQHRELNEFVPSFSKEDKSLVQTQMPDVTLLIKGLDGSRLGDNAYSALETAMNDYLQKQFEGFFEPRYDFQDVWTKVTEDVPYMGAEEGNAVTMATYLEFRDPQYAASEYELDDLGVGKRKRLSDNANFRDSDIKQTQAPKARSTEGVIPTDLELEIAAGHAFNDLTSFQNFVLVTATIDNISSFDGMQSIEAMEKFAAAFPPVQDISIVKEEEEEEQAAANTVNRDDILDPSIGGLPSTGGLNVAAASAASLANGGPDRLNPLYPALIVGIGVFLFTIIVLGYRKHKARQSDAYLFKRGSSKYQKQKDNVMIHIINDSSTLEGDEEIEVEDTFYNSSPESSPDRKQQRKEKERELDKEYAASCLKPAALGIASTPPPSDSVSEDEESSGEGRKNCLKKLSTRRRSKRSLGEQDSMAYSVEISEHPRRVDLTTEHDSAAWRNPAQLDQSEGSFDSGDMTKKERKRFNKYIQSGLTIEEASSQIMNERKASAVNRSFEEPTPPSSTTQTRTGTVGGYTHYKNGHRGQHQQQQKEENVQSNPMGCFDPSVCGDENTTHEVMTDGTGVHYDSEHKPYMSLGEACSANDPNLLNGVKDSRRRNNRNIEGTARAMVITEASSYASSYDDDEFDRVMAEAEAETSFI